MKDQGKQVDPDNLTGYSFTLVRICLFSQKWLAVKILSSILLCLAISAGTPFITYKITTLIEEENTRLYVAKTDVVNNDSLISDTVLGYQYYLEGL